METFPLHPKSTARHANADGKNNSNSIIATAVPRISDEFNSLSDVGWYGSAYLLTTACLQLFFGKLYSYLPIKTVFICAIGVFELGSLLCGVAQGSVTLIVGRAIAGIGSAGVYSGALVILAHSVPVTKRPLYSGFIGAMNGISSVAGPLLGGVFTDKAVCCYCGGLLVYEAFELTPECSRGDGAFGSISPLVLLPSLSSSSYSPAPSWMTSPPTRPCSR